jgi:hypothetical protein
MSNNDLVQGVITDEGLQAIQRHLGEVKAALPFLVDLTVEDRRTLPKMGDKSRAFVEQALVLARQNEGILPRSFDLDEFGRDVDLIGRLAAIDAAVRQLAELLDDTLIAVGSDAYSRALVVYSQAKLAGKGTALDQHLDSLGQRFARRAPGPSDKPPAQP